MNKEGAFPSRVDRCKSRDIAASDVTGQSMFDIRSPPMSHEGIFLSRDDFPRPHDVPFYDVMRQDVLDTLRITRIQSMAAATASDRRTHTSSFPTKDSSFRHPGVGNIRNSEGPEIPEEYCKDRFIVRGSPFGYFQSNAESNPTVIGYFTSSENPHRNGHFTNVCFFYRQL